jgi:hypothetical protein
MLNKPLDIVLLCKSSINKIVKLNRSTSFIY